MATLKRSTPLSIRVGRYERKTTNKKKESSPFILTLSRFYFILIPRVEQNNEMYSYYVHFYLNSSGRFISTCVQHVCVCVCFGRHGNGLSFRVVRFFLCCGFFQSVSASKTKHSPLFKSSKSKCVSKVRCIS